ncbi:MAG: hypothetical protein U0132_10770 [Gemmatimonadaceae bacterium]
MAIWSKLKTELDRAGKAAAHAIDEGKVRLEVFRARQLTDKAAQALGYAVYRAHTEGTTAAPEAVERLLAAVAEREAEVRRLEESIRAAGGTPPQEGEQPPTP